MGGIADALLCWLGGLLRWLKGLPYQPEGLWCLLKSLKCQSQGLLISWRASCIGHRPAKSARRSIMSARRLSVTDRGHPLLAITHHASAGESPASASRPPLRTGVFCMGHRALARGLLVPTEALETHVSVRERASECYASARRPPMSVGRLPMSIRGPGESDSGLLRLPELLLCPPGCRQEGSWQEELPCQLHGLLCPAHQRTFRPPRGPHWLARCPPILAGGPPISVSGLLISTRGSHHFCICQMASHVG